MEINISVRIEVALKAVPDRFFIKLAPEPLESLLVLVLHPFSSKHVSTKVFGWEWEGDLYRLFRERSSLRKVVSRRDPMTLGIFGAEAVRECVVSKNN